MEERNYPVRNIRGNKLIRTAEMLITDHMILA